MGTTSERPAVAGELCTCGREARVVYVTERWGEVGYCGRQAWPLVPCRFCGGEVDHDAETRCPRYRVRP